MFDTFKAIKYLERECKFSEEQAASIVRLISGSVEHNPANLPTIQDIEWLRKRLANIEDNTNKTRAELSELSLRIEKARTEIAQSRVSFLKWILCISTGGIIGLLAITVFWMSKYVHIIYYLAQHTTK